MTTDHDGRWIDFADGWPPPDEPILLAGPSYMGVGEYDGDSAICHYCRWGLAASPNTWREDDEATHWRLLPKHPSDEER